jgi:hypothetical protein
MAKKKKKMRTKGGKIEKNKASSSFTKELESLNSRMPPWFVSMIHSLDNMISLSNPLLA